MMKGNRKIRAAEVYIPAPVAEINYKDTTNSFVDQKTIGFRKGKFGEKNYQKKEKHVRTEQNNKKAKLKKKNGKSNGGNIRWSINTE